MKEILSATLAISVITAPVGVAFAQNSMPAQGSETPYRSTPELADISIRGSQNKGSAVREDNNNPTSSSDSDIDVIQLQYDCH